MAASRLICIAGGSGAGKSTLADGLAGRLGDRASILHLDDYQKPGGSVPRTASGRRNYDHPDAVDFPKFTADLRALRAGIDVAVVRRKKGATMESGVAEDGTVVIPARPLVLVEGYLALWHPDALGQYDLSIFLDAPPALRLERRRWAKDPQYVAEVLVPMHDLFIEPTKRYAHLVIDVTALTPAQVLDRALAAIGE